MSTTYRRCANLSRTLYKGGILNRIRHSVTFSGAPLTVTAARLVIREQGPGGAVKLTITEEDAEYDHTDGVFTWVLDVDAIDAGIYDCDILYKPTGETKFRKWFYYDLTIRDEQGEP